MRVILITGASSGIGRALAIRAARAGYDVVAIGRNRAALDTLAELVRAEHAQIATGTFDVADPANAPAIVALARETFGRLDVLVNNAGQVAVGALSQQSDDALRAQFGTHVIGPVALVREALPLLRDAKGHVFMLGSGVARVPVPGLGAYPPSKAATRSASSILRSELKPDGIAVTYVDPGAVDTVFMTRAGMPGAPAAILATPEDVARKILLAVRTRPRVLNAVPWQTAAVGLAEFFPAITDLIIERNPTLVGTQDAAHMTLTQTPEPAVLSPATTATWEPSANVNDAVLIAPQALHQEPPVNVDDIPAASDEAAAEVHVPDLSLQESAFDTAIEPVRRRMERVKLREEFVRDLLRDGDVLDAHDVALKWAGMPNKNERAATNEVLDALTTAGFLERDGEKYRVVRSAG